MGMTDPIADLLTRIRNALMAKHDAVEVPMSKLKEQVVVILKQEGYVTDFSVVETEPRATLRVELRYYDDRRPVILGLKRVSTPGRRAYYGAQDLPKVRDGLGTGIISTSRGLMTDRAARRANIGGEFLCAVW
jgi:small subunit ribosomal protein S8